jgi:hypothetical protein
MDATAAVQHRPVTPPQQTEKTDSGSFTASAIAMIKKACEHLWKPVVIIGSVISILAGTAGTALGAPFAPFTGGTSLIPGPALIALGLAGLVWVGVASINDMNKAWNMTLGKVFGLRPEEESSANGGDDEFSNDHFDDVFRSGETSDLGTDGARAVP